jgi:hypothetical protein
MSIDWSSYVSARRAVLAACADPDAHASQINRAAARLQACLKLDREQACVHARRSMLCTADAIFHEQLIASGDVGLLRRISQRTDAGDFLPRGTPPGGLLVVSLHYGLATSVLPLWLAMTSQQRSVAKLAVINDSRRHSSSKPPLRRLDRLNKFGCDFTDIDLAGAGELGAMRQALRILREGGIVLIYADGQLAPTTAKHAIRCRLGSGSVAFPHGVAWLAQKAATQILPIVVRPRGDDNQIACRGPYSAGEAQTAVQALLDAAIGSDPAPWRFWCSSSKDF